LVDKNGKEDMGNTIWFFRIEASHAYTKLPQNIKSNRQLLKRLWLPMNLILWLRMVAL
jgi:hypothetical protein